MYIGKLCVLCLLVVFNLASVIATPAPKIDNGVIDARIFDFTSKRMPLTGNWMWYDNVLLPPDSLVKHQGVASPFPSLWNNSRSTKKGTGVATYSLSVVVSQQEQPLAIELPQIYSSFRLWLNGDVIMENGTVSDNVASTVPQWKPGSVSFDVTTDTLKFVLQIANFHHHKGGIKDPIYLSSKKNIDSKEATAWLGYWIQFWVLLVISLIFVVVYFIYDRKKIIVYFALLCLSWSIRTLFSNEYLSVQMMPDFDWALMVRIEYITLFFTMIWAILYLGRLFPKENNQIIKYILVTANSLYIAIAVIATPVVLTRWLGVYLVTSAILLIFGAFMVIKALINEQVGSGFLTFCTFLSVLLFSYDIFTYEGFFSYNALVFSIGYILLFSSMGVALLMQLNIIKTKTKSTSVLTYADLYGHDQVSLK